MTKREKFYVIFMVIATWGHIVYNRYLIESNSLFLGDLYRAFRNFLVSFS